MRAAAIAAIAARVPASCHGDSSDRDRVARAFVAAAIRLAPTLPDPHRPHTPYPPGRFQASFGRRRRCGGGVAGCVGDLARSARP